MPFGNVKQHLPAGGIESDLAVVAAAEGLSRVGQIKTQRFQCLFLLGSYLAVLVLAVEHMAFVDVGCAFVQMQRPVQNMNMISEPCLELLDEFGHDRQKNFARSMVVLCSQLIDGLLWAGLAAGQQVGNGAVALCVPNLGIALVLTFHKIGIAALVKLSFYLREGRCQIVRVLRIESRTEAVEAVPVDVAFGSFRVDVLTVGKVETPVIVLGVIGAVGPGSSVVSC